VSKFIAVLSWILIIIVAGVFYYFYTKKKSVSTTSADVVSSTTNEKEDWLESENFEEIALQHLAKFPKRTGRELPTYEELLELDEDEFKAWMFVKAEGDYQEQTLKEMIKHESKTGSFAKTGRENDPPQVKMIVDVFNKEKSAEVVEALKNLDEVYYKYGGEEAGDIVNQSIYAKGISDYYKVGEK